jgi:hypothetical protein
MNYKTLLINFYEGTRLNELINKMCPDKRYVDDLKQELILHLLEKDKIELLRLLQTGEIYFYSYGYLRNQYHSSTSEFFKKYRNFEKFVDEVECIDFDKKDQNRIIKIDNILETKVDFFSAFLFRKYYYDWFDDYKGKSINGRSYRKIENEYSLNSDFKIDHTYIFHNVRKTLELIKNELGI